jgi:choline dehydrogenase-like flavoprotein
VTRVSYDAIVVGSGAGGACVAWQLTQAGMKTLMLEKGPARAVSDFHEGGVFGPGFSSRGRGDELKFIQAEYLMPELRKEIRYLRYSEPGATSTPAPSPTRDGWMSQLVGGGTVHFGGASFRFEDVDFAMKTRLGELCATLEPTLPAEHRADLQDWPIDATEMCSWYALAESQIGIAGAPGSKLPPLRYSKAGKLLNEALSRNGHEAKLIPTPMAINSGSHHGRDPCHHSGLCQDFACRFEAKSDMRVTLLRAALATGNLTIQPRTFVRQLHLAGTTVQSIECVVGNINESPTIQSLSAPVIIVACETLETNRLMLASGIGNREVVGRYLMYHMTGGARSIAPVPTTTWDTAPHTAFSMSYYHHASHDASNPFLKTGILMVSSNGGPLAEAVRKRYWGVQAKRYFDEVYPFKLDLSYIGDCMPTYYNQVLLRRDQVDRYGMPGTEIIYQPHPFDMHASAFAAKKAKEMLKVAGARTEDDTSDPMLKKLLEKKATARQLYHCTGGCRMGFSKTTSVVDETCRVHELDNLYLADGSVFPTGSGLNPTLTLQANALRVGSLIASKFG